MQLEKNDSIAILRLDNGKANALNEQFFIELNNLILKFLESDSTALVLTGSTGFFSGGLSLPEIVDFNRDELKTFMHKFETVLLNIFTSRKPIVCAINGHAIAGGLVIALQCDYRMAASGKYKLGLLESKLGIGLPLVPVEAMKAYTPKSSWMPIAYEAELFDPTRALELGAVDELIAEEENLESAAIAKAIQLGKIPQVAFQQIKHARLSPHIENIKKNTEQVLEEWMDTWFSDQGQALVKAQVQSLKG